MQDIEQNIYKLLVKEFNSNDFEQWVYNDPKLKESIAPEDYLELLSLDYKLPSSWQKSVNILNKYIKVEKYYDWQLRRILRQIIKRPVDVHHYIQQCYDLYCNGYNFLENIGLGYGLHICVPPDEYNVDNWDELDVLAKATLIDSFYPGVQEEAGKVLHWLDSGKILLTGYDETSQQVIQYDDSRSDKERKKRFIKP